MQSDNIQDYFDVVDDLFTVMKGFNIELLIKTAIKNPRNEIEKVIFDTFDLSNFDETTFTENLKFLDLNDIIKGLKKVLYDVETLLLKDEEKFKVVSSKKSNKSSTSDLFGKYAWSDEDWHSEYEEEKPEFELSTDEEKFVFWELEDYFSHNNAIKDETASTILSLIDSKKYSNVLKRYTGVFYRGMRNISLQSLSKISGLDEERLSEFRNLSNLVLQKKVTYKPKYATSAWTEDLKVAEDYSSTNRPGGGESGNFNIVLQATSKDNKNVIQCVNALYKIKAFSRYANEKEVLAVDDVIVDSIHIRPVK